MKRMRQGGELKARAAASFLAAAIITIGGCSRSDTARSAAPRPSVAAAGAERSVVPAGGHPLTGLPEEEEYGEFLAKPEELASAPTKDIVNSTRLNAIALVLGKIVYDRSCAQCHGADLRGDAAMHAPNLTDEDWRFSGDDRESGGNTKLATDIEWTVRYGVRSGHPYARGVEADMLAFDPQYRNEHDLGDFGTVRTLSDSEIDDVAEYVLKLSGQAADEAKAELGMALFLDNAKGNCFDCHGPDGTGIPALGASNLTRKELFLFGSDKSSIVESIVKGRRGVMPGFEGTLKPEEIKAVSVYVFSKLP